MANKGRNSFLVLAALGLWSATAPAQSGDSAVAQALFDEGKALMSSGQRAQACPKFEESQRLDPHSGTLINLASCYELTDRLASAWSAYIEAASAAQAAGNAERAAGAKQRAAALAPRLSRLMISVAPALQNLPGLEVRRDGVLVRQPQWSVALPADAGEHEVTASAPGRAPFAAKVTVAGERSVATLSVPNLGVQADEHTPALSKPFASPPPQSEPAHAAGLGTSRTAAVIAGGVGVVGVGLGTAFGLASIAKHDEAAKYCAVPDCSDQRGVSAGSRAQSDGNLSTIMMIVGGVGLAAGVTLWLTAAKTRSDAAVTEVGLSFGTLQLKRTF